METATRFIDKLTFAQYPGLSSTSHFLIFLDGRCIEHVILVHFPASMDEFSFDFSMSSKWINKTLEEIQAIEPQWKTDIFNVPMWFFIENDNPFTWRASRYEFLKEWSCDHDNPTELIKSLMELG